MNEYLSKIKDASIPIIEKHKKELVSVSLRKEFGTNIISITIDDPVTFSSDIDEIASINQEILDIVNDDIPDGYYLEVTTPGVERELKENEYEKSIGKYICIKTYQKLETAYNLKEIYGTLISVDQDNLSVEALIKQRKKIVTIPKDAIAKIRLAIKF